MSALLRWLFHRPTAADLTRQQRLCFLALVNHVGAE
jgi:hypothetical protein